MNHLRKVKDILKKKDRIILFSFSPLLLINHTPLGEFLPLQIGFHLTQERIGSGGL